MSQTAIATTFLKKNNYAVIAGDLAITFAAMDASNGNSFVPSGREVLIFQNSDSAAHTITITSVADKLGRVDTSLVSYSIPANGYAAIQASEIGPWIETTGLVYLATSSALVKVAILQTN